MNEYMFYLLVAFNVFTFLIVLLLIGAHGQMVHDFNQLRNEVLKPAGAQRKGKAVNE